jgi:hypothetical protein
MWDAAFAIVAVATSYYLYLERNAPHTGDAATKSNTLRRSISTQQLGSALTHVVSTLSKIFRLFDQATCAIAKIFGLSANMLRKPTITSADRVADVFPGVGCREQRNP